MEKVIEKQIEKSPLSEALVGLVRYLGIGLAGLGALILLIEGSRNVDSIGRFFAFSGVLTVCALLGFYLSIRRTDHKNARLLVGLFLACVPIFWSQLAAVFYAGLNGVSKLVPSVFQMPVASITTIIAASAIALGLIVPLSSIVARIFVPRFTASYATVLSLMGSLLCLPVRHGTASDLLLMVVGVSVLIAERLYFSREEYLQTAETRVARGVVLTIPLIFVGRASCYEFTPVAGCISMFAIAGVVFWFLQMICSAKSAFINFFSDLFVALGLAFLPHYLDRYISSSSELTLSYVISGSYLLLRGAQEQERGSLWSITAFHVLLIGSCFTRDYSDLVSQIVSVLIPVIAIAQSYKQRQVWLLIFASLVFCTNFASFLADVLSAVVEYRWVLLMTSGIGLVFGASYLESGIKKVHRHWAKTDTL